MKKYKKAVCIFILLTLLVNITGCAAYIDINDLPLILGAAVDKGNDDKYILTVEVFKPTGPSKEKETKITTEILQTEGETIFDAIRNLTIKLGKRAYWTHLKVFIISKDIAKEGISPVLDMFTRSSLIRMEFPVGISNDDTAFNIFYKGKQTINEPVSNFLNNTIKSVDKISKYDYIKLYNLIDDISIEGHSAVLPLISMNPTEGSKVPSVYGVAVFKKDKMVGTLDPTESKTLRLLKNKEKGGLLIVQWIENSEKEKVTLEIFKSKTKIQPVYTNNQLKMNINITSVTEISEVMNYKIDVLDEKGREKLKKQAEDKIKYDIENLMRKLQKDLECDAVGFGKKVKERYPKRWKESQENWSDAFRTIPFNVSVDVIFRGTASTSEELKID